MAISANGVTVAVTATLLSGPDTDNVSGQTVFITNSDAASIFVGPSTVTTATGYPVAAGASLPWPIALSNGDAVYAISAAGTSANAVKVLRTGV